MVGGSPFGSCGGARRLPNAGPACCGREASHTACPHAPLLLILLRPPTQSNCSGAEGHAWQLAPWGAPKVVG